MTASATSTMVRVVVWGFALGLGTAVLRESVSVVGTAWDAFQSVALSGSVGVVTALGSGLRGFSGTAGAAEATALATWVVLAVTTVWYSAGRSPHRR